MNRFTAILIGVIILAVASGFAQSSPAGGPYKVLKTARVGGEGNWDYRTTSMPTSRDVGCSFRAVLRPRHPERRRPPFEHDSPSSTSTPWSRPEKSTASEIGRAHV